MEDYAPFVFLRNWVLMAPYLCSRFHIFNRPILEEYVSQVKRGPHRLQSCLHAMQNGLPLTVKEMHPSFESLVLTNAPSLQVFFMNFHHNTSFRSILEDDPISLESKACIHFCLGKGERLWLVIRPSICSFRIAHFIFTSTLCFCLGLILPSASSLFMCECEHRLDAPNTHLVHCPFGNQQITTHDAI